MTVLQNTLYVTTPGAYLRLEGETVVVEVERKRRLQVPLHHLGSIVCFGASSMSPALMARCAEDGRSVVWLSRTGRFHGRLEGPVNGNVLLRLAQFRAAEDPGRTIELARACVAGKLRNSRSVLLRGARETEDSADRSALAAAARRIAAALRRLPQAEDRDTVRGHEGEAAQAYFEALPWLIRPDYRDAFSFTKRVRRPPTDAVNAMLSFLYALLLADCRAALEAVGLDPQLGYLHDVRPGRAALALDLMEELRAPVADRLALTLINRGQLHPTDFEAREGGAVLLTDSGRRTVIAAYQQRKQEQLTHPVLQQKVALGVIPHVQARLMARCLRGDAPAYVPFLQR
jgi:CRISPR-associated protein Cas1